MNGDDVLNTEYDTPTPNQQNPCKENVHNWMKKGNLRKCKYEYD